MLPYSEYVPASPARSDVEERPPARDRSAAARAGVWFFALASLVLLALSGLIAWRWVDANLLHWGVADGKTTQVNSAELLQRVRAFELATVKHTYQGNAEVDAAKVLNAGPARVSLPSFIAGQKMSVKGKVTVTAGVDLARVRPEDMQVTRNGKDTHVVIAVPQPQILSAELVPNSLDMDTSAGLLTRLKTSLGLSEQDLRDQAADRLIAVTKASAVENGILDDAARESERRLQAFLQSLPQSGDGRITYEVRAAAPSMQ